MAEAIGRRANRLSDRERTAEAVVVGLYVLAALVLLVAAPPDLASVSALAVGGCLIAMAAALRVEFDIGTGITVPSQVAFVPLLFVVPPPLVLIAVPAVWAASKVPEVVRGRLRPVRLLAVIANSWFAVGPCVVLVVADLHSPSAATPMLLTGALLAQFAGDFCASALREAIIHGATLREQLREVWVYGIDTALTPVGLLTARALEDAAWSVAALLPLLGVLAIFARERRARVESLVELNNAYHGTALVLGDVVEADDGYTGEHCRAVVTLAVAVGDRLGLDPERRRNLEFAALLHDVGKVAIPKDIINKPGKLDPREWQIVKTHTIEGQRMLDRVGGFMSEVGEIVRSHHERWGGGGYPDGLAGEDIPPEARIISCCDSWNAMTTTRAYRPAMPAQAAAQELRACAGTQFDPRLVDVVLAIACPEAAVEAQPQRRRVGRSRACSRRAEPQRPIRAPVRRA